MITRMRERGFTLIESIVVMTMLGIAAVGMIALNSSVFSGLDDNRDMQVGVSLMQECAEKLLSIRRKGGFTHADLADSTAATAACNEIVPSNPNYSVTITNGNSTTSGLAACPYSTGNNCKLVAITQGNIKPVTMMLVNL